MTLVQAMQRRPPVTTPDATLRSAARQMASEHTGLLPVIEANGELVGLVDLFDLEAADDAGSAAGPEPEMARRVRGEPH